VLCVLCSGLHLYRVLQLLPDLRDERSHDAVLAVR
jgi:hypothetical protein